MKNLKKFVALLLAGVMAMVLFTACSGGGNSSNLKEDTEAEAKVLGKYSTSTVDVKNDKDLRAVAEKHLDTEFNVLGYAGAFKAYTDKDENGLVITIIARYDYKDTLLNIVLDRISNHVDKDHNVSLKQDGVWTNIGVVVKGNNQQSYLGVSIRIKNYK